MIQMEMMKWKIRDSIVTDQEDNLFTVMPDGADEGITKIIVNAPIAFAAMQSFIADVNSGTLKPRQAVKKFEKILEKLND